MALSVAEAVATGAAVFLDRDGVINRRVEGGYVRQTAELKLLPGAAEAIAQITRAGATVLVVTNQRAVARGLLDAPELERIHARLASAVAAAGGRIDGIYVCPHEIGQCDCRKPASGLIGRALGEHPHVATARSHIIGDSISDLQAGARVGLHLWLVGDERESVAGQAHELGLEVAGSAASLADLVEAGELLAALRA